LGALDLLHAVDALAVELLGGALVAGVGRRRRGEPAEADAGEREGRPGARATGPGLHRPRMTPARSPRHRRIPWRPARGAPGRPRRACPGAAARVITAP